MTEAWSIAVNTYSWQYSLGQTIYGWANWKFDFRSEIVPENFVAFEFLWKISSISWLPYTRKLDIREPYISVQIIFAQLYIIWKYTCKRDNKFYIIYVCE